jgi:predicted dehydrogenase
MLVAKISSADVSFDSAAFTTIGAVAIHGVRTAEAKLGDVAAVIGLGLLGQLTLQVLNAAGCRVIGIDPRQDRAELAAKMGALAVTTSEEEFRDLCVKHSGGDGADSVLITAETPSSGPVNLASEVVRDRGIVVAVGTVGMELQRKLYYKKELDFRVSRSYGPGRYDAAFEQKGRDYPIGYVRWTETRNMEAFLQLLADGKLDVKPLITHSVAIERATEAYDLISGRSLQPFLGVLIRYPHANENPVQRLELLQRRARVSTLRLGVLGAGNFAQGILIPVIKELRNVELVGICAPNGARVHAAAKKFGFAFCATDDDQIFSDTSINTVAIATRHHLHADQVIRALQSGKHVFCEKPLCLSEDDLERIERGYEKCGRSLQLMVGFNRRFAPLAKRLKKFLGPGPFTMHYRVNAGPLPKDHWINDPEQGGGRILGEVCHFVDFLSFMCGSRPSTVQTRATAAQAEQDLAITIQFENGSLGTIAYVCNGDRVFSKERLEIFGGGCIAVIDDFRKLELVRHGGKQVCRQRFRQDKGHAAEWRAFADSIQPGGPAPIPFEEIVSTTLATIRIADSLRSGREEKVIRSTPAENHVVPLVSCAE